MNPHVKPPVSPSLLAQFAKIVGERYAITDPAMQEPYLREMRDLYHGSTPDGAAAGLGCGSLGGAEARQRDQDRDRAAGRQHRTGRRADPASRRDRSLAQPHGQDPRGGRDVQYHHRGGRRVARPRARGGGRRRPALSAAAALRGHLHGRRQPVDQCGRHHRGVVGRRAPAGARPRSRAGRRARAEQSQQAEEGQHRLRSEKPVHRRRRHARHHHRGERCA